MLQLFHKHLLIKKATIIVAFVFNIKGLFHNLQSSALKIKIPKNKIKVNFILFSGFDSFVTAIDLFSNQILEFLADFVEKYALELVVDNKSCVNLRPYIIKSVE